MSPDLTLTDIADTNNAIDGSSLISAINDLQQLDADALAALNEQSAGSNGDDLVNEQNAMTPSAQDPSAVPVTSMDDPFSDPSEFNNGDTAPPDLSDTNQTTDPLAADVLQEDQDPSLLNL